MRCFLALPAVPCLLALLLAWATLNCRASAADFPAVSDLPARAELPDPLVMLNGDRVTTKDQWFQKRRPELKELFQHYMYGYLPPAPQKVDYKIEREDNKALDGKATLKEVTITLVGVPASPKFRMLLLVPNQRKGPAPVFLGLNFSGNAKVLEDTNVWAPDQTIERGYALATFHHNNISPDSAAAKDALFLKFGNKRAERGPHDWATIAAWAWGLMRGVDYLLTDKDIDPKRIAVVGHSRLGKTALLAAAFDDRIALSIPLQAGCGGTAPSRGKIGESVTRINTSFPHWFNGAFKEFNDKPEKLPFDQHCLVALVAPRPVLFANAVEDTWANPDGQFDVLKGADPVYRFVGAGGLDAKTRPEIGKLVDSTLGYFIRPGKHSMTREDWKVFLDFADKHLGKPAGK
jgi:hypothetical protein